MNFAKFLRTLSGYSAKNFNVILVLFYIISIISIIFSIIISIYSIIFYLIIQSTHKLDKKINQCKHGVIILNYKISMEL